MLVNPNLKITPQNLPEKFTSHFLGHKNCQYNSVKPEIDQIFSNQAYSNEKAGYIFASNNNRWIFKSQRKDPIPTTHDTHLYRVRKAIKIENYVNKHGFTDSIYVPKKFLYWNESENQFYVVVEKLDLSDEVSEVNEAVRSQLLVPELASILGGQLRAAISGAPKRWLTAKQASGLAQLAFIGYTDQTYNNAFFLKDGRVAILDTEPVKRAYKKSATKGLFFKLFGTFSSILTQQSLIGTAKLKSITNDETKKVVEKVEKKAVLWQMAKMVSYIATTCLLIGALCMAPIPATFVFTAAWLKTVIIAGLALKVLMLALNSLSIAIIYHNSSFKGLAMIGDLERRGII